jgi:dTDP-4-dehydrorhamnose 3,5-epimerase
MKFTQTDISGVIMVEAQANKDTRGHFARTFCTQEFKDAGIDLDVTQCNTSYNAKQGTLRGMHFQAPPYEEPKLVRCVRGSAFDVVIDLRPASPTYCKWVGMELSANNLKAFFMPKGCAHGFLTLEDDTELFYTMGTEFVPGQERGVRWDDSAFAISWPSAPVVISERDTNYLDFIK